MMPLSSVLTLFVNLTVTYMYESMSIIYIYINTNHDCHYVVAWMNFFLPTDGVNHNKHFPSFIHFIMKAKLFADCLISNEIHVGNRKLRFASNDDLKSEVCFIQYYN